MKITPFATLWIFALFLAGCGLTKKVEKDFYSNSKPKYSISMDKKGRKDGQETWWHPNGNKKYEALNRAGFREGKFTARYLDGKIWYEGYEYHGKPESTLTYWYPTGKIKSQALFRDGIQLERKDYDLEGQLIAPKKSGAEDVQAGESEEGELGGEAVGLRKASLQIWALRVRQTVEGFWILPKQFQKERPYRAVAKIKVAKEGKIIGVSWIEKSPSAAFNNLAQQTFKRIKRLPAFPPQIKDQTLEVQYEFISLGKQSARKKLEALDSIRE